MKISNIELREKIKNVLSEKDSTKNGLSIESIFGRIVNTSKDLFNQDDESYNVDLSKLKGRINAILSSESIKANGDYSKVKNPKTNKFRKGIYKIKKTIDVIQKPEPPAPEKNKKPEKKPDPDNGEPKQVDPTTTLFVGKAGECAVMSELLFRGYNANLMIVDDGVDIVASKNNLFFFIQVKTTTLKDKGRIYASIKRERFEAFTHTQIRYVIVARCNISGLDTNLYFVFNNQNIDEFIFDKLVNRNESMISIKIRIDEDKGNKPILYHDNKEKDITFYMNKFNL